jgi:hypothetical protein
MTAFVQRMRATRKHAKNPLQPYGYHRCSWSLCCGRLIVSSSCTFAFVHLSPRSPGSFRAKGPLLLLLLLIALTIGSPVANRHPRFGAVPATIVLVAI